MSRSSSGLVFRVRQAGTGRTGIRSTSRTRNRKDRDPAPITIEARSATEHGLASSRSRSTASRLARCAEPAPRAGIGPPRYTIRSVPATRAARAKFSAADRSRVPNGPSADDSIERLIESLPGHGIAREHGDPVGHDLARAPAEPPDGVPVGYEPRGEPGPDIPRDSGHEHVHRGWAPHGAGHTKLASSVLVL